MNTVKRMSATFFALTTFLFGLGPAHAQDLTPWLDVPTSWARTVQQ